jgi:hypothetical protein
MDTVLSILWLFAPPVILSHIICLLTRNRKTPPAWFEAGATALIIGVGWIGYGFWAGSPIPKLGDIAIYIMGVIPAVVAIIPTAFVIAFHCERRRRAARRQFDPDDIPDSFEK